MSWGECYLDHFERLFFNPVSRSVFQQSADTPSIQVLGYDQVFEGCRLFASLGLSHYAEQIGCVAEVVMPLDGGWDEAPALLGHAVFFLVQQRMQLGWGTAVGGLRSVRPEFVERYGKSALYFTKLFGELAKYDQVDCNGAHGSLFLTFPISDDEYERFRREGAELFEQLLEAQGVDPFAVARVSAA